MTVFQKMNSTLQGTWNQLNDSFNHQQNFWDVESQVDPRIITDHYNVVFSYFERRMSNEDIKLQMNDSVSIIRTPPSLFDRHITTIPISPYKAINLAQYRERCNTMTTVFGDPKHFYFYSEIDLILSKVVVDCYNIVPRKDSDSLYASDMGKRWAIFEKKSGSTYHFNWRKWNQVPARHLAFSTTRCDGAFGSYREASGGQLATLAFTPAIAPYLTSNLKNR